MSDDARKPAPEPPPPPRRVTWKVVDGHNKFNILFGLGWLLGGLMMAILNDPPVWEKLILNRRGVRAEARVALVEPTILEMNDRPVFNIHLEFTDRQGRTVRPVISTSDGVLITSLRAGKRADIEYDPEKPERCRFAGNTIGITDILPLLFMMIGFPLAMTAWVSARGQIRIHRHGVSAQARVIRVARTPYRVDDRDLLQVSFEYTVGGRRVNGSTRTTDPVTVGDGIWVLYDPRRPGKSLTA